MVAVLQWKRIKFNALDISYTLRSMPNVKRSSSIAVRLITSPAYPVLVENDVDRIDAICRWQSCELCVLHTESHVDCLVSLV